MTDVELAKRLEKLERDNRRFKRLSIAAVVVAAALGLIAATRPVPDVIKAHKFEAVDTTGVMRAEMGIYQGAPTISLMSQGKGGVMMTNVTGPSVSLIDGQGRPRASMVIDSAGPEIGLLDTNQKVRAEMTVNAKGPILSLYDPNEVRRASLSDVSGWPGLALFGARGATRIVAVAPPGRALLSLSDSKGFSMDLGNTEITLPVGATDKTSADSITMFSNGKKHRVIWKAP